ncbi:hypothetical protein K438DRAFT_1976146 [Mycena galopus ATCC 62051]|nr:hypothetical protein K438DRAFT_1976146 [Mycena galopus ATCC 62051]
MSKHRSSSRQTVHNLIINGGQLRTKKPRRSSQSILLRGQGGTGGAGQAAGGTGGAGGTGTGPTVNYAVRTKSFVANYTTPGVPSDFRMIPLGDIDLQHEIGVNKYTGVQPERARVRRVYSARVEGRNSSVMVAMYQGDGAEEEWREDVAKYKTVRHPNLVQVWGTASMGNIHATIFHDDLIPLQHLFGRYKDSPLATVYLHVYGDTGFQVVQDYFQSTLQYHLIQDECTLFIRQSTGRLCTDLMLSHSIILFYLRSDDMLPHQGLEPLDAPNIETTAINLLTLKQYYQGCYWCFNNTRFFSISTPGLVSLSAVYYGSSHHNLVEIASVPEAELKPHEYLADVSFSFRLGELMENGWTR